MCPFTRWWPFLLFSHIIWTINWIKSSDWLVMKTDIVQKQGEKRGNHEETSSWKVFISVLNLFAQQTPTFYVCGLKTSPLVKCVWTQQRNCSWMQPEALTPEQEEGGVCFCCFVCSLSWIRLGCRVTELLLQQAAVHRVLLETEQQRQCWRFFLCCEDEERRGGMSCTSPRDREGGERRINTESSDTLIKYKKDYIIIYYSSINVRFCWSGPVYGLYRCDFIKTSWTGTYKMLQQVKNQLTSATCADSVTTWEEELIEQR